MYKILPILLTLINLIACGNKKGNTSTGILKLPKHFPPSVYQFDDNPLSTEGIELGRKLFYDPILSVNNTISCGSCHAQEHAFADHNVSKSLGVEGRLGRRNSPPIVNLIWHPNFNWDGGINHIEVQPIAPITDEVEMANEMSNVLTKLNQHPEYPQAFHTVFKSNSITSQQLLRALTQFMAVIISDGSRYDDYLKNQIMYTNEEFLGKKLFEQNCSGCHSGNLFTNFSFKNNGIATKKETDLGRYEITGNETDKWKFRVPSLRNVELTYPYLHDGSIFSLREIIKKYSEGPLTTADAPIPSNGYQFTQEEQNALFAFLKSLSDYKLLANPKFSPPPITE